MKISTSLGSATSFYNLRTDYSKNATENEKSQEDCLAVAKNYMQQYVTDIDSYTLVSEKYREIPEYKAIYQYEFVRKKGDILTSDKAYVDVTVYGKVSSHLFVNLGIMKDVEEPTADTLSDVQTGLNQKLNTIYSPLRKSKDINYTINAPTLIKLSDGKLALEYYVNAVLSNKEDSGESICENNHFIVYLE